MINDLQNEEKEEEMGHFINQTSDVYDMKWFTQGACKRTFRNK